MSSLDSWKSFQVYGRASTTVDRLSRKQPASQAVLSHVREQPSKDSLDLKVRSWGWMKGLVLLHNVISDSSLIVQKLLVLQRATHCLQDKPLLYGCVSFYSQHLNFIHIKTATPPESHVNTNLPETNTIHMSTRLTMDNIFFWALCEVLDMKFTSATKWLL